MNIERKAARFQVSMPPELLKQVDEFASQHYCTRSGLICLSLSQYMNAQRMGEAMEELYKLVAKVVRDSGSPADLAQLEKIHTALKLMRPDSDL